MIFSGKITSKIALVLSLLILFGFRLQAQQRLFDKAWTAYQQEKLDKAWKLTSKLVRKYPNFAQGYLLAARIMYDSKHFDQALHYLRLYYRYSSDARALKEIGLIFYDLRQYDSAWVYLVKYKQLKPTDSIDLLLETVRFRRWALKNPVPFDPHALPSTINTIFPEYFPDLDARNTLYFTRLMQNEDLFFSQKRDTTWSVAMPLSGNINTKQNEGACTVSPDGKLMVFTRCIENQGCDLYITRRTAKGWTRPERLPYPVNTKFWESQPCLANNGRTLLFVSTRPGGKGDMDIWAVDYIDGKWQNLRNLGDSINTPGKEMSPFLHFDGRTLYFASNYHPGMGGFDLFVSRWKDGHWSRPRNLGYPINSFRDEVRLVVNVLGDTAYFSSAKGGNHDLFYFRLYAPLRPMPMLFVAGRVVDGITGKPLRARITLYSFEQDSTIFRTEDSSFLLTAPQGDYAFYAEAPGYLFASRNFSVSDTGRSMQRVLIKLYPVAQGQVLRLHNIFFEFNSYRLKPESFEELDKLVRFLRENPTIRIEISGHTDSIGSLEYNLQLSEQRAKAVKQYLVSQGIDPGRMSVKGYGFLKPIASNTNSAGRRKNRRVEIKILQL